jgi:hypothetical protein
MKATRLDGPLERREKFRRSTAASVQSYRPDPKIQET